MWLRLAESLERQADIVHGLALKDADYQVFAATSESILWSSSTA